MKVSISEAARMAGISRQHLYTKYINPGLISVEKDSQGKPHIDTAELIRVFDTIALPDSTMSANGHDLIGELSIKLVNLDKELQAVRQQLTASQEREKTSQERESWLRNQVDKLTDTIRQIEHKQPEQSLEPVRRSWLARFFGRA